MGKNDKTGLGRALVKQHNQMIQQSKEKGRTYRSQHKKVLESVTEVSDIEAVIQQADEAERLFSADHPVPNVLIKMYVMYFLGYGFSCFSQYLLQNCGFTSLSCVLSIESGSSFFVLDGGHGWIDGLEGVDYA